jgi:hypothetical protein
MVPGRTRAAAQFLAGLALALAAAPAVRGQPNPGQKDDFQDGTLQNWANGHNMPPPTNVPDGGPAGAGDRFLQFSATGGFGAGGKLVIFNRTQWQGNYISAGISAIDMDLKNLSGPTLHMRIGMKSSTGPGAPGYESANPFDLPADGQWHHAVFNLTTGDFVGVNGPPPLDTFLLSVAELRILSEAGPNLTLTGDAVAATAGVDNIHAPVPEPGLMLAVLAVAGLIGCAARAMALSSTTRSVCAMGLPSP